MISQALMYIFANSQTISKTLIHTETHISKVYITGVFSNSDTFFTRITDFDITSVTTPIEPFEESCLSSGKDTEKHMGKEVDVSSETRYYFLAYSGRN